MLAMWDCCRSSPVEWCNRFVSFGLGYVALRIVGCGGGVRSVPGIVDSVVGRRPNTGVRLGRLINQNSHVIRVPELCAAPRKRCNSNDAISMFEIHVGELRATFLRNHKDPKQKTTQAEDNSSTEDPRNPDSRHNRHKHGALHPLRGGAPEQKRCIAYGSGAVPQHTRTNAELAHRTTHRHTPPCAPGPYWRQDGHTAHATTCTPAHSDPLRHLLHPYMRRAGKDTERAGAPATSREALRTTGCGPGSGQRALAYRSTERPVAADVRMASTTRRLSRASSMVTCSAPTPRIASRKRSCSRARGSRLVRA